MRNRLLLSLAGVVLLLVGVAGGIFIGGHVTAQAAARQHYTVRAGTSDISKYCATYEQTLANDLQVDPTALEKANIDALTKVLDQYLSEGEITQTEHDQLVPLLQQLGTSPCTQLDGKSLQKTIQSYLQGNPLVVQQALALHASLSSAVAGALHMRPDDLATALGSGKTVPQLAQQQHVDIAAVRTAYKNAAQSFLTQAVSTKLITQAQADALDKTLASAADKDKYPLLDLGSLASLGG
jgi:uncharacterized protein YneF (UPF0154 family)